jgi:ubiquinone/menaquinone biosynthesis C-methylase UbiE
MKVEPQRVKKDKHFPTFALDNFIRKLFDSPDKYRKYVRQGQVVADLGCGPGYFTFPLAEKVGINGRVYAVDSDKKAIYAVEKKASKKGYQNIESHVSSVARLGFIEDESVDFVLADGLLCCVAPREHADAVKEIKRIMKIDGKALLVTAKGFISYVDDNEWESMLKEFKVEQRNCAPYKGDRRAVVAKK